MYSKYLKFIGFLSIFTIYCQGFAKSVPKKSYAASTVGLMKLLEVEDDLVENIKGYVEVLKKKLDLVEQSLITMSSEHEQMDNDYEMYLGNPVNSFRLLHRLHTDWRKWHNYALNTNKWELEPIEKAHKMRKLIPTALDLECACRGIDDLMTFYDLTPEELAAGNLAGYSKPETALTAQDCLALGEFCIGNRNKERAEAWFNTSLARFENTLKRYSAHKAWGTLLMMDQEFTAASYHFGKKPEELEHSNVDMLFENAIATKLNCSAVVKKPSRLLCRYNSSTTAFTKIAPLKMEELSTDPYMVVYHDVIYDSEIDLIFNSSQLSLSLISAGQKSEVRSSKDSYIDHTASELLDKRVTDMTGLNMDGSEAFTLINYGIGGHYVLHHDYRNLQNTTRLDEGDRIATVLFYLGDVDSGGATIFPMINITVTPKKGSAVFWYNLHNSGAMNEKTLHSACPVISGSKYVLTKWINELPQAFRTPCMNNSNLLPESNDLRLEKYVV
ncbi:LOW QUALITY PROTEIN: prolyl 4-hydroxylase subunit alpha-1 [Drosophila rhopaloa]|uniref:procollagen-proline 4-dioxygenase n=1 Tax=Drosophila rhopaloa TaxID=1041015 RepID=A0ABM5HY37_DRORH|nr:LOW QUALITY PROTEIN: prolyl 4-hydroxylase subunit alpha-1 [Drosophila rhopaloa]